MRNCHMADISLALSVQDALVFIYTCFCFCPTDKEQVWMQWVSHTKGEPSHYQQNPDGLSLRIVASSSILQYCTRYFYAFFNWKMPLRTTL